MGVGPNTMRFHQFLQNAITRYIIRPMSFGALIITSDLEGLSLMGLTQKDKASYTTLVYDYVNFTENANHGENDLIEQNKPKETLPPLM